MKTIWTQHLDTEEERVKFEESLRGSRWLLDRLNEILLSLERGLDKQEMSPRAYDEPNWDYRQAHCNGYRQCLQTMKDLITLDRKEHK